MLLYSVVMGLMLLDPFKIIGARFPRKDAELLENICQARGEDISSFVRRAVKKELARMSYLSDYEKKALEIKPGGDHE